MSFLLTAQYQGPMGVPFAWTDETSGVLREAVMAYLDPVAGGLISAAQIAIVRSYIVYHIHGPIWLSSPAAKAEYCAAIGALQHQAAAIRTVGDITRYIDAASEFGLDPL